MKEEKNVGENATMAITFGALNVADYLTTKKILNSGGVELNPVVNYLIKKKRFGIFKIISTLVGMFVIYNEEKPKTVSKILNGMYATVVASNANQIVKHKRNSRQKK